MKVLYLEILIVQMKESTVEHGWQQINILIPKITLIIRQIWFWIT